MTVTNGTGGYERADANVRSIRVFIIALFLFCVFSLLLMLGLFRFLYQTGQADMPAPTPMEAQRVLPPAPRLQVNTTTDIKEMHRKEADTLESYGWVDRNAGVVRIPVSRAMDLILERGLPAPKRPLEQRRDVSRATASKK
jgi:hypothetical protein